MVKVEMQTLYPVACSYQKRFEDKDTSLAWKAALLRERKLCGPSACDSASEIICRQLAYSFSTSNVERLFLVIIMIGGPLGFDDTA